MKDQNKDVALKDDLQIEEVINDILETIERERERQIVARRFGLFNRRETLEQIGELLEITRERVRQLEKSIIANLRYNPHNNLPHIQYLEETFTKFLKELGNVARIKDLGAKFNAVNDHIHQSRILFLGHLSPKFIVLKADAHHHAALGLAEIHQDHHEMKRHVSHIIKHITEVGEPISADSIHLSLQDYKDPTHVHALASLSKKLSNLNQHWGLNHWPTVNPKNIRDKIYIILRDTKKPMHFSEIATAIRQSSFSRNKVTIQAIHNELIKDSRFVLMGRGTYALKEWGYKRGTVADVIYEILEEAGQPLDRDTIVKEVLQKRQVKQTTILLNLQCKPNFKRLKDGRYTIKPK